MSLEINIELNGETIAWAKLSNVSELADLSDYRFTVCEVENPDLGIPAMRQQGKISGHRRKQSVWAIVKSLAEQATK